MYFLLVFLSLYLCISSAQDYRDSGNYFIAPSRGATFYLGDVAHIKWTTKYTALNLGFRSQDQQIVVWIESNYTESSYNWTVDVNGSVSTTVFYFLVAEDYYDNSYSFMDYIIVNRRLPEGPPTITLFGSTISTARSSIRSATDLSPPLGVVTSTTKSRPTVRPSPTFTYLPPETATSNVSAGAKAGIGVGVTLGVVAFAIAGVLVYTRLRKRRMDRQISSTMYEVKPDEKVAEMDAGVELPEMHGTEMYHELEGDVGKTGELHRLMGAEAPKNENPPKAQPVD